MYIFDVHCAVGSLVPIDNVRREGTGKEIAAWLFRFLTDSVKIKEESRAAIVEDARDG